MRSLRNGWPLRRTLNEISLIFRASGEMLGDRTALVHAPGSSWIDLASAADRDQDFDHARAFVHYADQSAAPIWRRMRDACVALAAEMGGRGIQPEDRHEVGSTWHDAGTLFMGDEPSASVTDTSGHFHHIGDAACVDQALFPTVGSANPVLTGLCLARKTAETIVARHVSEPAPELTKSPQRSPKALRSFWTASRRGSGSRTIPASPPTDRP